MRIKTLIVTLTGSALFSAAAIAGTYCPPECEDKCPVDCCEDTSGSVSVGYDTDYVWKGVRFARDSVWGDVNYTFDGLPFSPNIGVWHLSSLGSGGQNDAYGDEFNAYAGIDLPSICGFDHSLAYTFYTFPTAGDPTGSNSSFTYSIGRELFCGISAGYSVDYFVGLPDLSAWFHTFGLSKTIDITDCLALDLAAEVGYSDNLHTTDSGWNHYNVSAALPIALSGCATLTPYVAYNGTPGGWIADGPNPTPVPGGNANDVFYGGVNISVGF